MKLCDAIVTTLLQLGVRRLFGVSGANIEHVHDAVHRLGGARLRSVLAKHESGAAFMADGYARASRRLGVCCATSGGGMLNLAAGVAEAQASGVPLLALVGQPPLASEGRGGFQDSSGRGANVDAEQLWRAITKHTAKIRRPEDFWHDFLGCLRQALSGRQGATALLLPRDLMDTEVGPQPPWFLLPDPQAWSAPALPQRQKDHLMSCLRAARRPVLILGEAALRDADPAPILEFIEATRIGVVTTLGNIAAFPHDHPLFLGCIGVAGHPSAHRYVEKQADLVLAVGTQLDAMTLGPLGPVLAQRALVMIHRSLGQVPSELMPQLRIELPAGEVLAQVRHELEEAPLAYEAPAGYVLTRLRAALAPGQAPRSGKTLLQSQALALINRHLPDGVHLLFDAGNCAAAAAHHLHAPPGSSASIALGMGGMGYGVAAAIGTQLARQEQEPACTVPTVVLCGDGAFLMNGAEVHTAAELGLPILWVVFNNARHGMCATRQHHFFSGRVEASVFQAAASITDMAKGLSAGGRLWVGCADDLPSLCEQLGRYFGHHAGGPGMLELLLPLEETPPFTPFMAAQAVQTAGAAAGHEDAKV